MSTLPPSEPTWRGAEPDPPPSKSVPYALSGKIETVSALTYPQNGRFSAPRDRKTAYLLYFFVLGCSSRHLDMTIQFGLHIHQNFTSPGVLVCGSC